jgi:hypothetical protein
MCLCKEGGCLTDISKALQLVRTTGDAVQRCRLAYLLGESRDAIPVRRHLERLQLPEGGFPYKNKPGNPYSLSITGAKIPILAELDVSDTPLCKRLVGFLVSLQHHEGYWDENPALPAFVGEPMPFWDTPGDLNTRLWITADMAGGLLRLGQGAACVPKATEYLMRHRKPDGTFQGFRHTTWLVIPLLARQRGLHDPMVQGALKALARFSDWDATDLTWALESLHSAGLPARHDVVADFLTRLESLQEPDGRWKSADSPDDPVAQTLETLIVLSHFGHLQR